jgi:phosphoenolpyruvate carboxylase
MSVFEIEEQIRAEAKARRNGDSTAAQRLQKRISALSTDEARAVAAAFATYFDLVNLAEDNQRVQQLRQRLDEKYPEPVDQSIGQAVAMLKARGVTNGQTSREKQKSDRGNVGIVKGTPFSVGGRSTTQSKMSELER